MSKREFWAVIVGSLGYTAYAAGVIGLMSWLVGSWVGGALGLVAALVPLFTLLYRAVVER